MGKRREIMKYIMENKDIISKTLKIYNKMCMDCKRKLMTYYRRKMEMPFDKMCSSCQKMAREVYGNGNP